MRTNAGSDLQANTSYNTASNGTGNFAPANYIALTENTTAPSATDTALTGELTTTGFTRAQATYAHTIGTNVATLTKTFTSGDSTNRAPAKAGLFNASSSGTLAYETAISPVPTLVSGDSVAITWTFTF